MLLDGLVAERDQGITIDVAYRFFASGRRKFIVADAPGHEQYTRNMVTGASTADAAVVLVDARNGVSTQTRRHSYLLSLIGVRHVALAVNKMDLVDYSEQTLRAIEHEYRSFADGIGLEGIVTIPLSALKGDNLIAHSERMSWYHGPTLMGYLETVQLDEDRLVELPFRMPVQWINRPDLDFRGVTGMIAAGVVSPGDRIRVQPSGVQTRVERIVTYDGDLERAVAGQSVTLTLADEVDVSRGDVLSAADSPAEIADQFEAKLVWMSDEPLLAERPYLFKIGTQTVPGAVTRIKYAVNVDTLEHTAAAKLELNGIGVCNIALDHPIPFDPYAENPHTGGFIVIDRVTNGTSGAGMLDFALRRSHNIHPQHLDIDKSTRASLMGQKPGRGVVHGALGRRQVDDREPGRAQAPPPWAPHLPARRRQRAPRPQQGPRVHRCRPGREHPPRRGGREADGRRRADRAGVVHLSLPAASASSPGAWSNPENSSRCLSTRRSRLPSSAIARAFTRRPAAES